MIYTYLINKALRLSYQAHQGQLDKAKVPYIYHPYHLAEQMGDDEELICVALLHDVVEDSYFTLEDLQKENFPQSIVEAIDVLSHKRKDTYFDYIKKIKDNYLACKVKIVELNHNLNFARFDWQDEFEKDYLNRMQKYCNALDYLTSTEE